MNPNFHEPEESAAYSLEGVARITGVASQTILHYQESGLIRSAPFDDETVRMLRRIEHLRSAYEVNDAALRLILSLMEKVEHGSSLRRP